MLSFGEEAEDDETETTQYVKKNASKSKSVHDIVDDPKLSKETIKIPKSKGVRDESDSSDDGHIEEKETDASLKEKTDRVRDKLKKGTKPSDERASEKVAKVQPELKEPSDSDSDEFTNELERERKRKQQKKA